MSQERKIIGRMIPTEHNTAGLKGFNVVSYTVLREGIMTGKAEDGSDYQCRPRYWTYASIPSMSTHDTVNHPSHYTAGGVECIDAIAAATVGLEGIEAACTANAIKYLWRWKRKGGTEDLRKCQWYINHLLGEDK